jgi:hypothetical protein
MQRANTLGSHSAVATPRKDKSIFTPGTLSTNGYDQRQITDSAGRAKSPMPPNDEGRRLITETTDVAHHEEADEVLRQR